MADMYAHVDFHDKPLLVDFPRARVRVRVINISLETDSTPYCFLSMSTRSLISSEYQHYVTFDAILSGGEPVSA